MKHKINWDRSDTEEVVKGILVGVVVSVLANMAEWAWNKYHNKNSEEESVKESK